MSIRFGEGFKIILNKSKADDMKNYSVRLLLLDWRFLTLVPGATK
jgi:hypothetical protein